MAPRKQDDDDWVGTPPEGRIGRERSDPGFWVRQRPLAITGIGLLVAVIILLVAVLV